MLARPPDAPNSLHCCRWIAQMSASASRKSRSASVKSCRSAKLIPKTPSDSPLALSGSAA